MLPVIKLFLQTILQYLLEACFWFNANCLLQNNSKTPNIIFTLRFQQLLSNNLNVQPNVKLLDIALDSKHCHELLISTMFVVDCLDYFFVKSF